MKVSILGTEYDVQYRSPNDNDCDGECLFYEKKINITPLDSFDDNNITEKGRASRQNITARHEIIHAYFFESGFARYAYNEPLVDFLAMQFPKMLQTFRKMGCIEEDKYGTDE